MLIHNVKDTSVYRHYLTNVAAPGAGLEATMSPTGNHIGEVLCLSFDLNCDANAADRMVSIDLTHGAIVIRLGDASFIQTANEDWHYVVADFSQLNTVNSEPFMHIGIPQAPIVLEADTIGIRVNNIQVGDILTNIVICWKLWIFEQ